MLLKKSNLIFLILFVSIVSLFWVSNNFVSDLFKYRTFLNKVEVKFDYIAYDSQSKDHELSRVKEITENIKAQDKEISINFEMKVYSISDWNNVFQTATVNSGIRMELSKPDAVGLVIGTNNKEGYRGFHLCQILFNQWYKVGIQINKDKRLRVVLDDKKILDVIDSAIDYDISDIAIGTGFNKSRGFQGEIKNFNLKYGLYQRVFILEIIIFLTKPLIVITVLVLAYKLLTASHDITFSFIFYLIIIIILLSMHVIKFIHLPMGEDASFYAYISKAVANGMAIHNDIYISSNSIAFYAVALIFKIFGASPYVYKTIHIVIYYFLVISIYIITSHNKKHLRGFIAAMLSAYFITIPHVMGEFGRNYINLSVLFILVGFYLKTLNIRHNEKYFAICLGLSSLVRETFVIVPILYILFMTILIMFNRNNKSDVEYHISNLKKFIFFLVLVFSLNALLLTIFNSWNAYFKDMMSSGTNFRYSQGFFSASRIFDNIQALAHGYNNFYSVILLLGLATYLIDFNNLFVRYLKFMIIPAFIIESIIINKSTEYSITPILTGSCILSAYGINHILTKIFSKELTTHLHMRDVLFTILFIELAFLSPILIKNMINEFQWYSQMSKESHQVHEDNTTHKSSNEHTERLLYVTNQIPHKTVSTNSQYPFLFLSKNFYGTNPWVEDLSAAGNMNRPELWTRQLDYIEKNPPDLLILKTTTLYYLSKWTDLGKISDRKYMIIADFDMSKGGITASFKDRILISKNKFASDYELLKMEKIELPQGTATFTGKNELLEGIIVKLIPQNSTSLHSLSIESNKSKIQYDINYTSDDYLTSFVPEKESFAIKRNSTISKDIFLLEFYRLK